jgi:hypothetical protein
MRRIGIDTNAAQEQVEATIAVLSGELHCRLDVYMAFIMIDERLIS